MNVLLNTSVWFVGITLLSYEYMYQVVIELFRIEHTALWPIAKKLHLDVESILILSVFLNKLTAIL